MRFTFDKIHHARFFVPQIAADRPVPDSVPEQPVDSFVKQAVVCCTEIPDISVYAFLGKSPVFRFNKTFLLYLLAAAEERVCNLFPFIAGSQPDSAAGSLQRHIADLSLIVQGDQQACIPEFIVLSGKDEIPLSVNNGTLQIIILSPDAVAVLADDEICYFLYHLPAYSL